MWCRPMQTGKSEGSMRTDTPLRVTQAQVGAPPAPASHWAAYSGGAAIYLAIVLLVIAGGFVYVGRRLRVPLALKSPGHYGAGFMIAIWLLSIYDAIVAAFVYGLE